MSEKKHLRNSNKFPRISIIVPSYNKGNYINQTLQSIVDQKYPNYEVLIFDSKSSDNTSLVVKKFIEKHPDNILFFRKKDHGQYEAINNGFKKSTGELLAFINADDYYENGTFTEVANIYKKYKQPLWVVGKGKVVNEKGGEIAKISTRYKNWLLGKNDYRLLQVVNYIFQPSVFISKVLYEKYGPFIGIKKWVMEYDLWLKLGREHMPIISNNTFSNFRLTTDSASINNSKIILKMDETIIQKYTNNPIILIIHYLHNIGRVISSVILGSLRQ